MFYSQLIKKKINSKHCHQSENAVKFRPVCSQTWAILNSDRSFSQLVSGLFWGFVAINTLSWAEHPVGAVAVSGEKNPCLL